MHKIKKEHPAAAFHGSILGKIRVCVSISRRLSRGRDPFLRSECEILPFLKRSLILIDPHFLYSKTKLSAATISVQQQYFQPCSWSAKGATWSH